MDRWFNKNRKLILFIIIISLLALLAELYIYQVRDKTGNPIRSDGWGYYSYLPAVFDYGDLSFSFSNDEAVHGAIWQDSKGNSINKYPVGVAVMQLPFFAAVDIFCKVFEPALATGYTTPYQISVLVATFFYFIIGIIFLWKNLREYFSEKVAILTLTVMCFATNLFHYATFDACFSHIYSFSLISIFSYLVIWIEKGKEGAGYQFLLGLNLGMILISRNPNVIVALFYLLYKVNNMQEVPLRLRKVFHYKRILFNILGGAIPVAIQCMYWFLASGNVVMRSYSAKETFDWAFPHIIPILFSVRKGMFFYSPILLVSVAGIWLAKYNRQLKIYTAAIVSVIAVHLYITSAWYGWTYGGSLGQRPFVDIYVFYAILIGAVFQLLDNIPVCSVQKNYQSTLLNLMFPVVLLLILISLKYMLAYWHQILPYVDPTIQDILNVIDWNFEEIREVLTAV